MKDTLTEFKKADSPKESRIILKTEDQKFHINSLNLKNDDENNRDDDISSVFDKQISLNLAEKNISLNFKPNHKRLLTELCLNHDFYENK